MKKVFLLALFFAPSMGTLFAQAPTVRSLIDNGAKLYDQGRYYDAIAEYQQALTLDNNSAAANLEMANTYIALQNYPKAIQYSDKVIQINDKYVDQAYMSKGSAQDMAKNTDEAIATFQEGIKKFPNSYLLLYNAALTCLNANKNSLAANYAARAVAANPRHASSHLVLGSAMYYLGDRVQSLLALYNFLLLEPNSKRSANALAMIEAQMKGGVSGNGKDSTTINISFEDKDNEFSPADLALSLMEAVKKTEKNKPKTEEQLFFENTESLFRIVDKTEKKDRKQSVWWKTYMPLYHDLIAAKNTEAFSYYILSSKNTGASKSWMNAHKDKMEQFAKWWESYRGKE